MEDTNNSFFSKFQIQNEMRARRKKLNEGEEEEQARMRLLGARGRNKRGSKVKKKAITEEQTFFYYVTFIF